MTRSVHRRRGHRREPLTGEAENSEKRAEAPKNTGALRVEPVDTAFGEYIQGNWALYKPAIYKQRTKNGEPDLIRALGATLPLAG